MSERAKAIMFLGTGSDVGKSIAATAFCRILKRRGFKVAPFKAQNMSNNSFVTVEGGEIGRAQVVQAEAAGLLPSVHMNPILLKPSSGQVSQIILQGKVAFQMKAMEYHQIKPKLVEVVMDSYNRLSETCDVIVMEGAGSCCEMNLKENDLVNFQMALAVGAPCVLVADIDRGGVFAQIIGSYHLMEKRERELLQGFIINKFRGDPRLFDSGIRYIEERTGKPVLGLVPYYGHIHIDPEDSVAVQPDKRAQKPLQTKTINIAVVLLPSISNFTDLEILEQESDVVLNYLSRASDLKKAYDMLILPGTKNVMSDAKWMTKMGWKRALREFFYSGKFILGICGGYQLLGEEVLDPYGVEAEPGSKVKGLGFLPVRTLLEKDKIVRKVVGNTIDPPLKLSGYEIHMGRTEAIKDKGRPFARIHEPGMSNKWEEGWVNESGHILGTYIHGVLDSPSFRGWLLNQIREWKGLKPRKPRAGRLSRFREYDKLADHFQRYCDVERIISFLKLEDLR